MAALIGSRTFGVSSTTGRGDQPAKPRVLRRRWLRRPRHRRRHHTHRL